MSFVTHLVQDTAPEYLTAGAISAPHAFSTRLGGMSQGALSSLNLGIHRGDSPANVLENYRRLGRAVGFSLGDLVFTRQTHTDIVEQVGRKDRGQGLFWPVDHERDGLITNEPGVALTVFSADCTPILLYDPVAGAIGAVHSGWRGTAAGIVARAVEKMEKAYGCKPRHIRAAIGPCIGPCCFETHGEVPAAMEAALGRQAKGAIFPGPGEKFHVDLKQMNVLWLQNAGVEHIDVCPDCTCCQKDRFWSHRQVGNARGSLAAVIMLKEE